MSLDKNSLVVLKDNGTSTRWEQLKSCSTHLSGWGLRILHKGLEPYAKTLVYEPRYVCRDHRNLHSNFYSKKFKERTANCERVHFFTDDTLDITDLIAGSSKVQEGYIGYSVIRPVPQRCLGRTIIDPWKIGMDPQKGFHSLRTAFKTHLNGISLFAYGFPYLSQDTEATVCAHSALWCACRYLSERYSAYPELYPYDIIKSTTDTRGRVLPYHGLNYQDYSRVLIEFGCHPEILNLAPVGDPDHESDFRTLCSYVESGFPVLVSYFGHVACVIGHTMDYQASFQVDKRGWVDSSAFLKQFVIVDDNFFPYQLLGRQADPLNCYAGCAASQQYSIERIRVAVCPLPEKAYLPPTKARKLAEIVLETALSEKETEDAIRQGLQEPLVLRLFMTTSSAFKRRKIEKSIQSDKVVDPLGLKMADYDLPHFIWVMEASPLSLYRKGQVTSEIVLDATANAAEECLLFGRFGHIVQGDSDFLSKNKEKVAIFSQYTHNLGEL